MRKSVRQLYLGIFLIGSAIALPLILLSASGYTWNWQHNHLEQTGSVWVTTLPKKAKVEVIELATNQTSPVLLNQLKPGQYTIRLTKPQYQSWQGHVDIVSGQVTDLSDVTLFLEQPVVLPQPTSSTTIPKTQQLLSVSELPPRLQQRLVELTIPSEAAEIITVSADDYIIRDVQRQQLWWLQLEQTTVTSTSLSQQATAFAWQADTEELLIVENYALRIITDLTQASTTSRTILRLSTPIQSAQWHPAGQTVIFASQGMIAAIDSRLSDQPQIIQLYNGVLPVQLQLTDGGKVLVFEDNAQPITLLIQ